ncbi:MAG TPA: SRPBCC family protein, partial [Oceanipulchritudo sp.]|nr:SRPBCC family protein [Oceanipulchritudo sp.]
MKIVKWLIILVAALFGLFLIITFFLPKDYSVSRSLHIEAPAPIVYSQVADLEAWQEWNPWNQVDPEIAITYGERSAGTGAAYSWESDIAGDGEMRILEAVPNTFVRYELIFEGYEDLPSYSKIEIQPKDGPEGVEVTWTFEGNVGSNFFARWMSVMVDRFV